jgi:hypothetical protein
MAMPTGDTPQKARDYYEYLLAHHQTEHRAKTWNVDWLALAWVWGFVVALSLILLLWVWQYRSTRHKVGLYPVDSWSGFTTELAGPATRFFIVLSVIIVGFAVALIVGHLVNGQIF